MLQCFITLPRSILRKGNCLLQTSSTSPSAQNHPSQHQQTQYDSKEHGQTTIGKVNNVGVISSIVSLCHVSRKQIPICLCLTNISLRHRTQSRIEPFHYPISLRMLCSSPHLLHSQYSTNILQILRSEIGAPISQQASRNIKLTDHMNTERFGHCRCFHIRQRN